MLLTLAVATRIGVYAIVDVAWGLGFVVIAALSFVLSAAHGDGGRRALVLTLTAAWGLRLATHIYRRNRGRGEDPRYARMLRGQDADVPRFVLTRIYLPQGRIMWVVSLPLQVAMYTNAPMGLAAVIGTLVWLVGMVFEALGDWQLARFKADPANHGTVMDRGLWRYTRHPNYFGDACVWWGLFLIACDHWLGLLTIVSPLLMTHLLVNVTGKALLERQLSRTRGQAYADYVARTSGFFPLPPKRT
jgi:steroid 5-alpha reductase family enzyme